MSNKDFFYIVYPSIAKLLNLKGTKKDIFFVIYSFHKNNKEFTGSIQFLADTVNVEKRNIYPALEELLKLNLIVKKEFYIGKSKFCKYSISDETSLLVMKHHSTGDETSLGGGDETSLGGDETSQSGDETSPNNIVQYSTKEIVQDNIQNSNPNIFSSAYNTKLFKIYQEYCYSLIPLGGYKSRRLRESAAEFLKEINYDFEYVKTVFNKANDLKTICDQPIDLQKIINNHERIASDYYKKLKINQQMASGQIPRHKQY